MSRTFRHIPTHRRKPLLNRVRVKPTPPSFIQKSPDGQWDMTVAFKRDNRTAGLREQRIDRHEARMALRDPEENDYLPAGKMRRYSLHYGEWYW